jgi:SAM-dependent methyltransferase
VRPSPTTQPGQPGRSLGDAAAIGSRTLLISELLCESVDLHAGERVLNVPCGSGNAALAAARRFCRVVGVDDLPFPDGSFEAVLSVCDATSTPGHGGTAGELLRVCRPGGRIGVVGWTPDGYIGELFATIGRHLRAPADLEEPMSWGTRERLRELFGPEVAVTAPRCSFLWRFPSAEHQVEFFASFHDPTATALRALGPGRAGALKAELLDLARRFDVSEGDSMVLRLDYLEAVVRKPGWL